jgi:hypothetical protein
MLMIGVAHLVDLGTDLRQGLGRIVVELEPDLDGGETQGALRLDIVDAVGGGDGALQGGGNETTYQIGAGTDINGGHCHCGVFAARILADIEGADRLQTGDSDQQADHQGQYRAAYK